MKLSDLLRRGAAISPDRVAVVHGKRQISYRDLLLASARLSRYLNDFAAPSGSRVAILCENSIEYVIFFFAVLQAGHIAVPMDTSLKPDKWRFVLNDCGANVLLNQAKYTRFIPEMFGDNSPVELVISDEKVDLEQPAIRTDVLADILEQADHAIEFDDLVAEVDKVAPFDNLTHDNLPDCPTELAAIFYTSGSTGAPKGVMLSHRNLISNTVATVEYLKLTQDDSVIVILPFHYIYGNSLLLTHALVGGRLVIDNRFAFPHVVLQTMIKQQVTGFSGVPSNFMLLLGNSNFASEKFEHLRYLTQAGGSMAPEVIRKVMAAFPDKEIYIMYGQTEASPRVSYLPPELLKDKVGSIGIPVPGVTIRVTDESGHEVPPGEVGEITVSGDNVMLGYWNQPEEQSEVLKNGSLYTGDLARRDKEGFLYVVSRKKEIIKVGGNRVSAKEIEERILQCEKVLEVAVVGVEDDILGEAIKAVVVLKEDQTAASKEIQDHCRATLAPHKAPKYIEFVKSLPKYQSGKVNKLALVNP
jgi:long-chain acyl-CoA synthetase